MGEYTGKTYTKDEYDKLDINAATGKPFGQASDEVIDTQIKDWQNKGVNVVGAEQPEDIRSLGSKIIDWADTPDGLAVLSGLGLAGAAGLGLKARKQAQAEPAPKVEPYASPSYDFETTAREVPNRPGLPQPSTPTPQATIPTGPAPAPTGVPSPAPQVAMPGEQQPQMKYGETKYNVPTASPNVPVASPVEANAPVAPKPIDPYQQAKIDKLAAETALINQRAAQDADAHAKEQQRRDDAHKARLSKDANKVVASQQKSQGKPVNGLSNDANALVANAAEGKMKADLVEATGTKPKNPLPIGGTNAPMPSNAMPVGEPPVSSAPAPTTTAAPVVPSPEKVAQAEKLTKEQKGMKNYLVSQYGGGPDGEAAYKKVIDILGEVPAYEKGQGGGLTPEANNAIKDWRKANIEGPKVNLTHDMKKVMKGAGGLAILTALPGFAEAAQKKDVGKMTDIFTDFFVLPFAQSRGTNEGEEQELAKRRYEGAVGGGRGIAPPSAYLR